MNEMCSQQNDFIACIATAAAADDGNSAHTHIMWVRLNNVFHYCGVYMLLFLTVYFVRYDRPLSSYLAYDLVFVW